MKAEFLRHEYTWSKRSIDGKLGLGVSSSSKPKDQNLLDQIEKLSGMVEPDCETGMEVERLIYDELIGFVKAIVKPVPAGEDKRQNKKVYLYHCTDATAMDPAIYCIPQGSWEHRNQRYLPSVYLSEEWDTSRNILLKYHMMDQLPELLKAIYWCAFRGGKNLAFVTDWNRWEYAANSREIMYAIHSILPEELRKNAGYASFGCGMNHRSAFYFTDTCPKEDFYDLTKQEYHSNYHTDQLDTFFFRTLATIYWEEEALYFDFIHVIEDMIKENKIDKNVLRDIQWIFLTFCLQHSIEIPKFADVMSYFPQLFYRAGESETMAQVQDSLLTYYHALDWSKEDGEKYLDTLGKGISKKGIDKILDEMSWTLNGMPQEKVSAFLSNLQKEQKLLFTKLMLHHCDEKESIGYEAFQESQRNFAQMEAYLSGLDVNYMSDAVKDVLFSRSIDLLNDNPFEIKTYEEVSRLAILLDRKDSWLHSLETFLSQLNLQKEDLEDRQLDIACEIENIYEKLSEKSQQHSFESEKQRRIDEENQAKKAALLEESSERDIPEDSGESSALMEIERENVPDPISPKRENSSSITFFSFFIRGIPYGFLTGCILYLLNYGIVIGHWKISVGVGGMWMILMLNYAIERVERKKKDGYRLWQALGLCIFEGYIIEAIAWLFLPKALIVYFFLILGFLTVLIQVLYGLLLYKKRYEQEEEE